MKKIIFTSLVLFITIVGFSQEETLTERRTRFGITGGFNQDFFTSAPYSFNGLNFFVGGSVEHKLSERFALQLEVLYKSTQGSGYNTIEIPLFAKYKIGKKFWIYAGGQLNWSFEDVYADRLIYNRKPGDFALNLGIEYELSDKWYLFGRYVHNLKSFEVNNRTEQMRSLLIGVGYRF